jgi:hypothetical protein
MKLATLIDILIILALLAAAIVMIQTGQISWIFAR